MKQYPILNSYKQVAINSILMFICFCTTLQAAPTRILNIKPVVESQLKRVKLKEFVINDHLLTDEEKEFEIIDTPSDRDKIISMIDFAYLLQQYEEMMNAKVSGARKIRIKRNANSEKLTIAKAAVSAEIMKISPWSEWDVDILYNSNDDTVLNRITEFSTVEVEPYNNRALLGNIQFRTLFRDNEGREVGTAIINPVLLKHVDVAVMDISGKKGQILSSTDLTMTKIWVGANKKEYITNTKLCVGRELAKSLSTGDLIKASDLMNPVCAKKGDLVEITSKRGGLSISLVGTALQSGREGEIISFQNKSSRKTFSAKLVGDKKAEHTSAP